MLETGWHTERLGMGLEGGGPPERGKGSGPLYQLLWLGLLALR